MRGEIAGASPALSSVSPLRRWVLFIATGAYGFAVGLALSTLWIQASTADRLAGFMTAQGLDGRGPLRAILTLLLCAAVIPGILNRLLRPFARNDCQRWAHAACCIALFSALAFALVEPFEILWVFFPPLAMIALCYTRREREASFTSSDLVLVPSGIALFVAFGDLFPLLPFSGCMSISAIALLLVRLLISEIPSEAPPAAYFSVGPAAMVFEARFFGASLYGGAVAVLLVVLGTPWLLALLFRTSTRWERRSRVLTAWVIYPLIALTYPMLHDGSGAGDKALINFFEEGHSLLPASEMMRGERPYVDIVPGHGLLSDGVIDLLAMELGASNAGAVHEFRALVSALFPLSVYLVALRVTGTPHAAMLTILYSSMLFATGTPYLRAIDALHGLPWLRALPAFFALSFAVSAVKRRRMNHLAVSGALLVVSILTGLEFAFYSTVAPCLLRFASAVIGRRKWAALGRLALGVAAAAVPVAIIFAICGFLVDSIRVTLFEILPLGEVYAVGFFHFPQSLSSSRSFPEILRVLFHSRGFWIVGWGICVVVSMSALSAGVTESRRRTDPLWILGIWIAVAAISYAERLYAYYLVLLAVFVVASVTLLWQKRKWRRFAPFATMLALLFIEPAAHLQQIAVDRRNTTPEGGAFVRYEGVPRASGSLYRRDNIEKFIAAKEFVDGSLGKGETFFDFANMPILYYLLEKPCPIRQYEVPFFQPESLQREVILRLERDRSVRAALMVFPNHGETGIDGVPNPVRAPLVWQYLQERFQPAYQKNGVVFWTRRASQ